MLDYGGILDGIRAVADTLRDEYDLVAAGGTALVLYGIKTQTRDVDYIVEKGCPLDFKDAYQGLFGNVIDVSFGGSCFSVRMPDGYLDACRDFGTYGHVRLRALGLVDAIITKSSRFNERDKEDLRMCIPYIDAGALAGRISDYQLHANYTKNIRHAMSEVRP